MKIIDSAVRYRTSVLVLTIILALGGLYSYVTLPKESFPSIEIPTIVVTTIYPGASPSDIASLISQPIEQEIQGINGIDEIRSTSTEGVSTVIVEFNPEVSMDEAYQKVRDRVDIAKAEIPGEAEEPLVSEINTSEIPIMTINLAAEYPLSRLKDVAEDLQDELEKISSILEVNLVGGLTREVQVNVDLGALQGYNLTFNDVVATIQQENTNLPGGSIDVDRLNYLVRVNGEFEDPEQEIRDLVVDTPEGGDPIYVRDVADVIFGFKERESYARLRVLRTENDEDELIPAEDTGIKQVISLNVTKRSGENILDTADEIRATMDRFPFPPGTQTVITGDQSENVNTLVKDLENNIISGLIFVIAVLLFFLGVRTATLVGIAIPLSMMLSFIIFSAMGQTLNFIILFSLIIALGMLVDNAVVIVENIYRFREEGYSRWEAAKLGAAEVGMPVVAATATTVAAFAPMMFWPGIVGEFMGYMPLTLIVTLSCSLFVALVINPVITGFFVRLEGAEHPPMRKAMKIAAAVLIFLTGVILGVSNWKTLVVMVVAVPLLYFIHTRFFKRIGDWFIRRGLPALIQRYRTFLTWMLQRDYAPKRAMLRNTLALGSFAGGVLLLILSGIITGAMGQTAGMVLLVPGGLLTVIGLLGILLHTLESIFLGGWTSVKAGLIFGAVMAAVLGLMSLGSREVTLSTMATLLLLPATIAGVGMLGALVNRKGRTRLILTDNRARLLTGSLGALIAIVGMFAVAPTGTSFFPDTDPNQVLITAEAPLGTNIKASNRLAQELQDRIDALLQNNSASEQNTKNMLINVGVGGDQQFGGGASTPERSRITLNLIDFIDRPERSSETLKKLRDQMEGLPGVDLEFTKDQNGPPTGPPVNIEITGEDFSEVTRIAQEVKQRLDTAMKEGRIQGLVDVRDNLNTGRPEFAVRIDRDRAGRFGLNTAQIASTVRAAINGTEASTYRSGEKEYDIRVRLQKSDRQTLESLKNLTILYEGQQIPLVAVADLVTQEGLGSVTRLDLQPTVTVQGDAAPGFTGQEVIGQVQPYLQDYRENLPAGYTMSYTGENQEQQEAFGFLTTALLIGVALIFLIMVAQFNKITAPFIIMVGVGLSLVGVLLGLIVTRTPFSLFTFIGVISLAGIVVNNSIVLVDYIMQLRERGYDKQGAIVEGGATRLRPVLLTALTTIIGLVPLTFGINIDFVGLLTDFDPAFAIGSENTQFWGPMGTAIISGLTFGTFLTLVIVPVMYSTFDSLAIRMAGLFAGNPEAGAITSETVVAIAGNGAAAPDVAQRPDGAPTLTPHAGTDADGHTEEKAKTDAPR